MASPLGLQFSVMLELPSMGAVPLAGDMVSQVAVVEVAVQLIALVPEFHTGSVTCALLPLRAVLAVSAR